MSSAAVLTLLGLLFIKEAGVPVPVPGDLLVLGAGVAMSGQGPAALAVLLAILVAGWAGGSLQFVFVRGVLRERLLALLVRFGLPRMRLDALAGWLASRGARGVALARLTPGLRVGAIAASALAALRLPTFVVGLATGNAGFVGGHFLLGYLLGPPALGLFDRLAGHAVGALLSGLLVLGLLAAAGAAGWRLIWRRRRVRAATRRAEGVTPGPRPAREVLSGLGQGAREIGGAFEAWADAACPVCLALAVRQSDDHVPYRGVPRE